MGAAISSSNTNLSAFGKPRSTIQGAPLNPDELRRTHAFWRACNYQLAIDNQIDRFTLAIDVIDRVPRVQVAGAHAKEKFRNQQMECRNYAREPGIDKPELLEWRWPA